MRIHPSVPVVGHHQRFGKPLRLAIDRTRAHRVYISPVGLSLRMLKRVSVALRCRCMEEACPIPMRNLQGILCTDRADAKGLDSQSRVLRWTCRRGEIKRHSPPARDRREGRCHVLRIRIDAPLRGVEVCRVYPSTGYQPITVCPIPSSRSAR